MYYPSYRNDSPRAMTVIGTASLSIKPDTVSIHLEVMTDNEFLIRAQQENALKMNQVIQALLQTGISKENMQTSSYNIYPKYDYVDGKQVFRGYQVTNTLTVKMKNMDQVGQIIDLVVKNGVNHVSNIQYTIENQQYYYQKALSNALTNALSKARTIAETLDVNFDPIPIKIVEEISEMPHPIQKFAAMGNNISTPIEPGVINIHAKVEVQIRY